MKPDDATVIVHFDIDGELSYHVSGDARLFIVDERAPGDRVYEWLPRATAEEIAEIIPDGCEIGHGQDERHAAVAHRVDARSTGRRHLSSVPGTDEEGSSL